MYRVYDCTANAASVSTADHCNMIEVSEFCSESIFDGIPTLVGREPRPTVVLSLKEDQPSVFYDLYLKVYNSYIVKLDASSVN